LPADTDAARQVLILPQIGDLIGALLPNIADIATRSTAADLWSLLAITNADKKNSTHTRARNFDRAVTHRGTTMMKSPFFPTALLLGLQAADNNSCRRQ